MGTNGQRRLLHQATVTDFDEVYELVQLTIRSCYTGCYTPSVIEAFCRYHSPESLKADISAGNVFVLEEGGRIVGTGTLDEGGYIGRVYVLPTEQGRGLGTHIMDELERLAAQAGPVAVLDSSVPGRDLYLHRGYVVTRTEDWEIEQYGELPADCLTYEVMEKRLR